MHYLSLLVGIGFLILGLNSETSDTAPIIGGLFIGYFIYKIS